MEDTFCLENMAICNIKKDSALCFIGYMLKQWRFDRKNDRLQLTSLVIV